MTESKKDLKSDNQGFSKSTPLRAETNLEKLSPFLFYQTLPALIRKKAKTPTMKINHMFTKQIQFIPLQLPGPEFYA